MAEAFFNQYAQAGDSAESAGLEPGKLNQNVVRAMSEKGIDISGNETKGVFNLYKEGRTFSHVITVCDAEAAQRCPIFPGINRIIMWSFPDPSSFVGSDEEIMEQTRVVRDTIEAKVKAFIANPAEENTL
jgi:arsenate reductase